MAIPIDVARDFYRALQSGQMQWAERLLSNDFEARGLVGEPLDKEHFLDLMESLHRAMPDLAFDARDFQQLYHGVWLTTTIKGTHTETLFLPETGPIEATGLCVELPDEHPLLTIEDGEIVRVSADPVEGGGLVGIFDQLGIESPYRPLLPPAGGEHAGT
ncbi:MAG: ester cyclase [Bradymonadaceae bacterium]